MSLRLFMLLGVAAIIEILAALLLRDPQAPAMQAYRLIHLGEMVVLIMIVAMATGLRDRVALLVVAGLLLSLIGDVVNSLLFDLSHILRPQALLSIPPFAAAHLCYIAAFIIVLRSPAQSVFNSEAERSERPQAGAEESRGFLADGPLPWGRVLMIWPVLALALWWLIIDRGAAPLLLQLSLGYALVVILMGLMALMLGLRVGGKAWIPAAGGLVFVLSDGILGLYLLDGPNRPLLASQAIWITYFLAQGLISQLTVVGEQRSQRA